MISVEWVNLRRSEGIKIEVRSEGIKIEVN